MMGLTIPFFYLVLAAVLILVFLSVNQVPQGYEWTVERFGRYIKTLGPGLHLIAPFIDKIGSRIIMKEMVLDIPSQEVISKDNAMVKVDAVAFYQVIDSRKAAYEIQNLVIALRNLTMTNMRTVLGSLDLDEMLSQRDHINVKLLNVVDDAVAPWGVKITRVEIKDISPPQDLVAAMASQMKAEREKRSQILTAEGSKQAAILEADGLKQSTILQAEAKKEAAFRAAEARERSAQAEARATEMLSEAIAHGNTAAVHYLIAQRYIDAFGELARNPQQKTLLMPMEFSQLSGLVSGLKEISEHRFDNKPTPIPQSTNKTQE